MKQDSTRTKKQECQQLQFKEKREKDKVTMTKYSQAFTIIFYVFQCLKYFTV